MSWLEEELKASMKRRTPPEGFAGRVMSRVDARRKPAVDWRWLGAMAASVALAIGGYEYREDQRRKEAMQVQAEVGLAFEITNEKLELVKAKLSRIGMKGEI